MGKLQGKVAIVSGSGRGIGREVALKLAGDGARVVVNDLDEAPALETINDIVAAGGEAIPCVGSVTAEGFGERLVKTAVDAYDGLDIIVNNAGYTWDTVIQKVVDEQWYSMLDIHLTAPMRILRAAQPYLKKYFLSDKENGREVFRKVVNISSTAGLGGNPGQVGYTAGKAGIIGVTKTLCKEWGRYNVNVNAVAFGMIETRLTQRLGEEEATIEVEGKTLNVGIQPAVIEMMKSLIPLGRAGTPKEAANGVYLLCIPESDYISGETLIVGGGFTA